MQVGQILNYPHGRYTVGTVSIDGLSFFVRQEATDAAIVDEIYKRKQYAKRLQIGPGDVVFDVGGHIGLFTCQAASLGASKIITVEPVKVNIQLLRANLDRNGFNDLVHVEECAVHPSQQNMRIAIRARNFGGSNLYQQGAWMQDVQTRSLDFLWEKHQLTAVRAMKLDCEGAEYDAIKDFAYFDQVEQYVIEFVGQQRRDELADLFQRRGYDMEIDEPHNGTGIGFLYGHRV